MKKIIVTTSWDDGDVLDLRILNLLDRYNLKGTFYLSKESQSQLFTNQDIREINQSQEVGAHTLNHLDLTKLDIVQVKKEIFDSKKWLEGVINEPVKMFAYPFGFYNEQTKKIVEQAGFLGARTTKDFCLGVSEDPFELSTIIHIYPFPFRKRDKNHYHLSKFLFQPLQRKFLEIVKLKLPINSFFNWQNLAKNLFDYTYQNNFIYHLWGHSSEIEKYGMWEDLEKVFKYIANREDVDYLTNREII